MPLSYSQLATYKRCPRQYEYAQIKKLPRGISVAESFGASVHNALQKWGALELKNQKPEAKNQLPLFNEEAAQPVNVELTLAQLLELWRGSFLFDTYKTRVEADYAFRRGEALMRHFFDWWVAEPRVVLAVEKTFSLSLDDTILGGRLDRVEQCGNGMHIIDFKTSAPADQESVDADMQLSLYALAAKELFSDPCAKLTMMYLREDGVSERATHRSEGQLKDTITQVHALRERIVQQDFHPTPSADTCRCCPYRGVCDVAAM